MKIEFEENKVKIWISSKNWIMISYKAYLETYKENYEKDFI